MSNRVIEDSRIDPRLKAMFAQWAPPPLPNVASREELLALEDREEARAFAAAMKSAGEGIDYEPFAPSQGLRITTEHVVSSPDGNVINLQIITPPGPGPFPCVYYIHGGGMMMSSCFDPNYRAWGRMIAHRGVAVVMVDFRNALRASSVPEVMPFPAGLNDCVSGLRWVYANHAALNVDPARLIIAGESGGANLTIASALRLKQDGDLGFVKGLYVLCPYLSGEWSGRQDGSVVQNAGILMDARSNYGAMAYGIEALRTRNPLAWPAFATERDVIGFPPVIISVNECDPLRDDGVDFYRLLLRSNVQARCREIMGTVHATEVYVIGCPEISRDAALHIAEFCAR
jgi:acetyl esterase